MKLSSVPSDESALNAVRAGTGYDCERCGLHGADPAQLCDPLCKDPRDENGNAPPRPRQQSFEWYGGAPDQIVPMLARSVFALAFISEPET